MQNFARPQIKTKVDQDERVVTIVTMNQETKEALKELHDDHMRGLGAIKEQLREDQKVLIEYFKMTNEKLDRHDMKLDQHGVRLDRIERPTARVTLPELAESQFKSKK